MTEYLNHNDILDNRATRTEDAPEEVHCTVCDEPLVFGMKDKHHTFSVGLRTVLECLYAAEQKGYTPPLPADWWIQIQNVYQQNLHLASGGKHECLQTDNGLMGDEGD